jgi:wyosine [tRNA(Phe)-imidazoG37] synthetase (radical SAM superfamily)
MLKWFISCIKLFLQEYKNCMATFLFDEIIFGPVKSRRFGVSLGINLLPAGYKNCTFNCIYCECGWTYRNQATKFKLPARNEIYTMLEKKLSEMQSLGQIPDNITFAGNGEPTIHPDFAVIIDDTIELRNKYFPTAEITVLSNSTMLHKREVFDALDKIDNNVLKLDTAIDQTFQVLNQPYADVSLQTIIQNIKKFRGRQIIQTLFIRGDFNGKRIDNTTEPEIRAWLKVIKEIAPRYVMVYPIARDTPVSGLDKIPKAELDKISAHVEALGIVTKTYY